MFLGAFAAAAVPLLRQVDESLMVTPCTITRPGEPVLDEDTGDFDTDGAVVFTGLCQVVARDTQVRPDEAGSARQITQLYEVKVPVSAGPFMDGDVVSVPDRKLLVQGLDLQSWQTSQHLPAIEVV